MKELVIVEMHIWGGVCQVWPGVEGWGLVDREGVGWQQCWG